MNDDDLSRLRALPSHDVAPAAAGRIERTALAAFDAAHEGGLGPRLAFLWSRVGVPIVLASVVFVYLGWAIRAAAALYR